MPPENKFDSSKKPLDEMGLVALLNHVNEEDIQLLMGYVLPEFKETFGKRKDLIFFALLFKLSEEELKDAIKLCLEKDNFLGIHKLASKIVTLAQMTGDESYLHIYKEVRDSQKGGSGDIIES